MLQKCCIICDVVSDIVTGRYKSMGTEDPFAEADEYIELQHLINQTLPSENSCSVAEYLYAKDEVPVCVGSSRDWENEFMPQLNTGSGSKRKMRNVLKKVVKGMIMISSVEEIQ